MCEWGNSFDAKLINYSARFANAFNNTTLITVPFTRENTAGGRGGGRETEVLSVAFPLNLQSTAAVKCLCRLINRRDGGCATVFTRAALPHRRINCNRISIGSERRGWQSVRSKALSNIPSMRPEERIIFAVRQLILCSQFGLRFIFPDIAR